VKQEVEGGKWIFPKGYRIMDYGNIKGITMQPFPLLKNRSKDLL
jgi:hypothetical protein